MQTETVENFSVRKRDGVTIQPYKVDKIKLAVESAWTQTGLEVNREALSKIINDITTVASSVVENGVLNVEKIQDLVETSLMRHGYFDVAKTYILYRSKRAELRETRKHPDPNAVADYIHPAKYARYIPELKRRETYEETVTRVEEMHLKKFNYLFENDPQLEKDIRWSFDMVREKRVLPSMRSLQFGGLAIEKINNRIYNCSATLIDRPRAFAEAFYLLLCGCGVGYSVQFEHVEKLPELRMPNLKKVRHHIIKDNIQGWAEGLNKLIDSYVKGYYIEFSFSKIRSEGAELITSGGKAPGHLYLKRSLERIRSILDDAVGRKLRSIECHDILCHSADAVLSGGIRRSAMIALFSLEDSEMMNAKIGDWGKKFPWRANANNSVMLKRDEIKKKQFKRVFNMTRQWGEPGFYFTNNYDYSTNPCLSRYATVLTPNGIRTIDDIKIGSVIWAGTNWTKVIDKQMTGIKPVFAFKTRAGIFYGTDNHRIVSNGEKIEIKDADSIDTSQYYIKDEVKSLDPQHIMDGLVLGDGSMHKASNDFVYLEIGKDDSCYFNSEIGGLIIKKRGIGSFSWEVSTTIKYLPKTFDREIPKDYYFGDRIKVRGFLRGLYSANGSVVAKRITLKATSFKVIEATQNMLSSLGIPSYYTINKANDVKFNNGTYTCKQSYDLNIGTTIGRQLFDKYIGFIHPEKTNKLRATLESEAKLKQKTTYDIVEIEQLGEEPVYDITVYDSQHTFWTGGLLVSNCCEIGLFPLLNINEDTQQLINNKSTKLGDIFTGYAFCNLTEINAAKFQTEEDFLNAARAAAIIGTLQSAYTNMPYLGWVSETIAKRDALLGVSMTGVMDAPHIALDIDLQRKAAYIVNEVNQIISARIGVRSAARTTCIKPSGTTSLELGCVASGHHPHHARRYIRRVVANELESVFVYFRSINPHMCVKKPNGDWVIEFPVEAPEGAIIKSDLSAIEFLELVKKTQINWVLSGTVREFNSPGLNHNVSNTCIVKDDEWDQVADYLFDHRQFFTGVSLLSYTGDKDYAFAPCEAVVTPADEAKWNSLIENYKSVDYTKMIEHNDETNLKGEQACAGGSCEL